VRAASALKEKMETKEFHPVADLFPLMGDEELLALADDIKANGLLEPIWLGPDGRIIDGRNRYRACELAEVEPAYRTWDGEGSLIKFAISLNLHRRHLNESQRGTIAAKIANMERGDNQHSEHGEISPTSISQTEAAEMLNVSRDTVKNARRVLTEGTPEEVAAVEAGEVAVGTLADDIRNGVPPELRGKNKPRVRSLAVQIDVPEGKTPETWVRDGLRLLEEGKTSKEISQALNTSVGTWTKARDIVRAADRADLSAREGALAQSALADFNETRQVATAHEMVAPIIERIWGSGRSRQGGSGVTERVEERRIDAFEHALAVIVQMGRGADALEVPHLPKERANEAASRLHAVALSINALRRRIMEIHQ
jgi:hypothetical protein